MGAESVVPVVETQLHSEGKGGQTADEIDRLAGVENLKPRDLIFDGRAEGEHEPTRPAMNGVGAEHLTERSDGSADSGTEGKSSFSTESVSDDAALIGDREASPGSASTLEVEQTQLPVPNDNPRGNERKTTFIPDGMTQGGVETTSKSSDGKANAAETLADSGAHSMANETGEKISKAGVAKIDQKQNAEESLKSGHRLKGDDVTTLSRMLHDDEVATTLAAASGKLMAAHEAEGKKGKKKKIKKDKQKRPLSEVLGFLHPKKFLSKLRDCYVDSCLEAADRGDMMELAATHGNMYYGESVLSRKNSQRKDILEQEEMIQASLSRQASASMNRQNSRQQSLPPFKVTGNASTGVTGAHRNSTDGMGGFPRQASGPSATFWNSPARKPQEQYAGGRSPFRQSQHPNTTNSGHNGMLPMCKSNAVATLPETDVYRPTDEDTCMQTCPPK